MFLFFLYLSFTKLLPVQSIFLCRHVQSIATNRQHLNFNFVFVFFRWILWSFNYWEALTTMDAFPRPFDRQHFVQQNQWVNTLIYLFFTDRRNKIRNKPNCLCGSTKLCWPELNKSNEQKNYFIVRVFFSGWWLCAQIEYGWANELCHLSHIFVENQPNLPSKTNLVWRQMYVTFMSIKMVYRATSKFYRFFFVVYMHCSLDKHFTIIDQLIFVECTS